MKLRLNNYSKLYNKNVASLKKHYFVLGLWCLTPLSTIFQLYLGQIYWGREET